MPTIKKHSRAIFGLLLAAVVLAASVAIPAFATGDGNSFQTSHPISGLYKSSRGTLSDGDQDTLRLTSAGLLSVSVEANTASGTDQEVVGNVAHDGVDSGNPVKIGGIGRATWETAASTAADRVNASFDLYGRLRTNPGYAAADGWSIKNRAAANTAATVSKAAGSASQRHVCTGFMVTFASLGAPTPEIIGVQIRDGATGAGTIVWEGSISLPAVAGESKSVSLSGLWLVGTAATAMTIETDAGGGANDYLSVSLQGVTIPN